MQNEFENLAAFQQLFYVIDSLLSKGKIQIEDIELVSKDVMIHLNKKDDLQVAHMSQSVESILELHPEEILKMDTETFFGNYVSPETVKNTFPKIIGHYQKEDKNGIVTVTQDIKAIKATHYSTILTNAKVYKKENMFFAMSILLKDLEKVTHKINKAIELDNFMRSHYTEFMSLTKQEKIVLGLIAEGLRNEDIAEKLFISSHTVRAHRRNINEKLRIKHFKDILQYAQAFDLL